MSDSSWNDFEYQYNIPKFLQQDDINAVIENLYQSRVEQAEFTLCFKSQHALRKFTQIYNQQINEQDINYYNQQQPQQQVNKFRRLKDFNSSDYQVRQLNFPDWRFLNLFMKIYQTRLKQMEIQYHYKFQVWGKFLRVFYPKAQKISSFFKNQIFQMKTKLNIHYCNEPDVIKKIKYSAHFNKLIQSLQVAAIYNKRRDGIQTAIFYSNAHKKKDIISIVSKRLFQHTTVLNLYDTKVRKQVNRVIFKLIIAFLSETIKKIENEQEIIVESNYEKCCILVHDRHQCHVDAKNEIQEGISEMMFFRLKGKDMRGLFNKIIKNHKDYPYLRVKYSRRALFCVFSHRIFHSSKKHNDSFCKLFKEYFQTLNQDNTITYYLKNLNYPNFIKKASQLIEDTNITINNYDFNMIEEGATINKIILGVKSLVGVTSVIETRKLFYQVYLKIMLRYDSVQHMIKYMVITPDSFSNILGLNKPSAIVHDLQSSTLSADGKMCLQDLNLNQQATDVLKEQQIQTSISQESQGDLNGIKKKVFYDKHREKKPKHIEIAYPFKQPQFHPDLPKFWDLATREKLQKKLYKTVEDPFAMIKFKTFSLALRQKISLPPIEQIQQDKIFLSTTIQKHNQLSYHFIDLNEFKRLQKQSKIKTFFVFYKLLNQQVFVPSYVIEIIS